MNKTFLSRFLLFLIICCFIFGFLATSAEGAKTTVKIAPIESLSIKGEPAQIIGNVIKAILSVVGAVALLMVVYGGLMMLTSAGVGEKIEKGKKILTWAVIGVAVILGSYVLVSYVITAMGIPAPASQEAPPAEPEPEQPAPETPPDPTACVNEQAKDNNGCCEQFTKYPDNKTNCPQGTVGGIYRCCDCGNTTESIGYTCVKGTQTALGQSYEIIVGHCGTAGWWCAKKK